MKTIVIQIGNSDDKLTQKEWSYFVTRVSNTLDTLGAEVHFSGGSAAIAPWQNYCWVVGMSSADDLRRRLANMAKTYNQDSIALTIGDTEFIEASK
jgi:hypothetical protein